MITIKEIFHDLTQVQRDALMVAFESHSSYFIEYEPGLWVGVNTAGLHNLIQYQQSGEFRAGKIKESIRNEQANHDPSI